MGNGTVWHTTPSQIQIKFLWKKQNSCQRNSISEKKKNFFQRMFSPRFHFSGLNQLGVLDPAYFSLLLPSRIGHLNFFYTSQKLSFSTEQIKRKFFILVWKTSFLYSHEKVKALHFRCDFNTAILLLCWQTTHPSN